MENEENNDPENNIKLDEDNTSKENLEFNENNNSKVNLEFNENNNSKENIEFDKDNKSNENQELEEENNKEPQENLDAKEESSENEIKREISIESEFPSEFDTRLDKSSLQIVNVSPLDNELCTLHIVDSKNDLKVHPFFYFPSCINPGVANALHNAEPIPVYEVNGQKKYVFMCNLMNNVFVTKFHKQLLEKKADLKYYGISSDWMRGMCDALMNNRTVSYFDLTDNWLDTDACYHIGELIQNNKYLETINLTSCRIGPEGVKRLINGIETTKTLKELYLARNEIGDEGTEILSPALTECNLVKLDLSHNNLKIIAGRALANALDGNTKLTYLDLSWNFIENKGMCPLLRSLKTNADLQYLNIAWNGLVEIKIEQLLKNILKFCRKLNYMDISHNLLKGEVVTNVSSMMFRAKSLITFRIGHNQLTPEDAYKILNYFQNQRITIKTLDIGGTNIKPPFLEILETIKQQSGREDVVVIYENILDNFTIVGPNPVEVAFKRANHVCNAKKKNFGEFILQLKATLRKKKPTVDEFVTSAKAGGIVLGKDLTEYLCKPFLKKKRLDIQAMAGYVLEFWPDTKLVLKAPQAENIIEEPPQNKKGKGNKKDTKKKKKK